MSAPLHVVVVIPRYLPFGGGTEIRMRRIALALMPQGFRFTVLTRCQSWCAPRRETLDGIDIVRLPAQRSLFRFFARRWLARHRNGIDLVHSLRLDKMGPVGAWAHARLGLPHLAEIITNEVVSLRETHAGEAVLQSVIADTDRFHCLTADTAAQMIAAGAEKPRIWLRANAVDSGRFSPRQGCPGGSLSVLCCGRLERQKGTDVLIEAWKRLPAAFSARARLMLVGTGKWEDRIRDAAADLDNVVFAGPQPRDMMPEVYRQAQIYVQPSRFEGMSNAILEALATGLPVVSTAIGGNAGVIENGVNGLVVPVGDAQALSHALAQLIGDADLRRRLGLAARDTARTRFSFDRLFGDYAAVYRDVAAAGGRVRGV